MLGKMVLAASCWRSPLPPLSVTGLAVVRSILGLRGTDCRVRADGPVAGRPGSQKAVQNLA